MTAVAITLAVLYTVLLWWLSTGVILWLNRRPARTHRGSLVAASAVLVAAAFGLVASMTNASPVGAVLAFTSAVGIWGWHELGFLMGFVTGPRRVACPPGASGWLRFRLAASTLLYHEIALVLTAALIIGVTWGQPNQVACWTFLTLLFCRLSAKLNLFLGVPNFTEEFFPNNLRYLGSYLRKSRVNALFPVTVATGAAVAGLEAWRALSPDASAFAVIGFSLIFALTALALLEHVFMVAPVRDAELWRWALSNSVKNETPS